MDVVSRPKTIAHRGDSARLPEQTLAAFAAAAAHGVDMLELDVRRSRDGHLVLMHDATVDRTTTGTGRVDSLSLAELRRLDAGSWFGPAFTGEQVPTLDDVLALAETTGVALCIEVKGETAAAQRELALVLAQTIRDRDRLDRDVLASFDHEALGHAAHEVAGLVTAPDRLPEHGPSVVESLIEQARVSRARIVQHHHAYLDADVVARLHGAGLAVWAWPTTTSEEIATALSCGVDAIMGDDAAALVAGLPVRGRS
jgi:glycerophosphoryl diester phosphodiesterase